MVSLSGRVAVGALAFSVAQALLMLSLRAQSTAHIVLTVALGDRIQSFKYATHPLLLFKFHEVCVCVYSGSRRHAGQWKTHLSWRPSSRTKKEHFHPGFLFTLYTYIMHQ